MPQAVADPIPLSAPRSPELGKLVNLLRELFQLDAADDLDFGMYRVLRLRREELTTFLEQTLTSEVQRAMGAVADTERGGITARMRRIEEQAAQFNASPEGNAEYVKLGAMLANASDASARERQVYAHLAEFFSRYYEDGDFLSLPRMKADTYAIPYDGSEVVLHWANKDQYYVKSGEYFARYAFQLGDGRRVVFRLVDAEVDPDNMKSADAGKRRVILAEDDGVQLENGELVCRFIFSATEGKQDAVNVVTERRVTEAAPPGWTAELTAEKPGQTSKEKHSTLGWHLRQYVEKNKRDYFVHKDLGGFLRREIDHYLKTEVFDLDSVEAMGADEVGRAITMVKAVRAVAKPIITFLASIEDFQKRLFLKKKMVLRTDWCVTLDRVPEQFYPEIAANKAQVARWKDLFAIDEIEVPPMVPGGNGKGAMVTVEFLKRNQGLVVETRLFGGALAHRVLQDAGTGVDRGASGLLVRGENLHALRLIQDRYRSRVDTIYIDPPYNTERDRAEGKFIYKDGYPRSSWVSMLADRLGAGWRLLAEQQPLFMSIDDNELSSLKMLADAVLDSRNFIDYFSWVKTTTPPALSKKSKKVAEYVLAYEKARGARRYAGVRKDSPSANTVLNASNNEGELTFPVGTEVGFEDCTLQPGKYGTESYDIELLTPLIAAGGTLAAPARLRARFRWTQSYLDAQVAAGTRLRFATTRLSPSYEKSDYGAEPPPNLIDKKVGVETNEHTSKAFAHLMGDIDFPYPKPTSLVSYLQGFAGDASSCVLDFFAGSGTTGHAVLNLNREDNGNRKFILVEVNDYFDTVLLPRILKATYSRDWKDGKPVDRTPVPGGALYKVLYLESYEDTLANITLPPPPSDNPIPFQLQRDYTIRYMLDNETRQAVLDLDRFRKPFGWTMEVRRGGLVTKDHPVDLVETFNYLIGLHVSRYGFFREANRIRYVEGTVKEDGNDRRVLVLWRDCDLVPDEELVRLFDDREFAPVSSREYDRIYVNGDPPLANIKRPDEQWKVLAIEDEFKRLSFADHEA